MAHAGTQPRIGGVLAELLRDGRDRYNARFIEARRYKSKIDAAGFSDVLTTTIAPIVEAVNKVDSSKTAGCFDALYDLSLELLGQELLGPRARCAELELGWQSLFPVLAPWIAAEPRKVAGSLSNALYNLAQTPGARADAWMNSLARMGKKVTDADGLLRAGEVAAWLAGMAHFRNDALKTLEQFSAANAELACGLLELPGADSSSLTRVLGRMRENPWITPLQARDGSGLSSSKLKIVKRIGAFKGFGGAFLAPPCVSHEHGQFVVGDGYDTWVLSADVFGATLLKYAAGKCIPRRHATHGAGGNLRLNTGSGTFPEFKSVLSAADDGQTLAVTVATSHTICLLAAAG